MITGALYSTLLMASCTIGGLFDLFDCDKNRHPYQGPDCCHHCAEERQAVLITITVMQRHPDWGERDDAAHKLRKFDWRRHPKIVPALSYSLLADPHEEVREEAAETLIKLRPCDASAHVALRRAADHDPDHATRRRARKALRKIDRRCRNTCPICGPAPKPRRDWAVTPHQPPAGRLIPQPPRGRRGLPPTIVAPPDGLGQAPASEAPRRSESLPSDVLPPPALEERTTRRPQFSEPEPAAPNRLPRLVEPPIDANPQPNSSPRLRPTPRRAPEQGSGTEDVPPALPPASPEASPFESAPESSDRGRERETQTLQPQVRREGPFFLFTVGRAD